VEVYFCSPCMFSCCGQRYLWLVALHLHRNWQWCVFNVHCVKYSFFIVAFALIMCESLTFYFYRGVWFQWLILLKIHDLDSMVWLFAAVLDKCHYSLNLSAGGQVLVTVRWDVPNFWFAHVGGCVRKAGCEILLQATSRVSVCPRRTTRLPPDGCSLNFIFGYSVKICLLIQILVNIGPSDALCMEAYLWYYLALLIINNWDIFCVRCVPKS
jgi:hypothetical protein